MKYQKDFSRSDRVGQQIQELVSRLFLTEIEDPRLGGVQILDVDVSPDLKNARLYYVMLSGEAPPEGVQQALDGVSGYVRREVGSKLSLRYTPQIEFRFDEAVLKGRRIDDLLSNLRDD